MARAKPAAQIAAQHGWFTAGEHVIHLAGHLRIESIQLAPGQEWEDQVPAWRFLRIAGGSAYWLDTSSPRALNGGELVVVMPGAKALVRASQLGEVLLHRFHFDPEQLYGFFTVQERNFFPRSRTGENGPVHFLPSTHPLSQDFAELVSRPEAQPELAVRVELLRLAISFFADRVLRHSALPAHPASVQFKFRTVVADMPELELINYTPEQLASLCGCSLRHFHRLFHAQFGEAPGALQSEIRLLKAQRLLENSKMKVAQVALDSGHHSVASFQALFRRKFGVSPAKWRKRAAKDAGEDATEGGPSWPAAH